MNPWSADIIPLPNKLLNAWAHRKAVILDSEDIWRIKSCMKVFHKIKTQRADILTGDKIVRNLQLD